MKRYITIFVTAYISVISAIAQIGEQNISAEIRPEWIIPTNQYLRDTNNNTTAIATHIRYSFRYDNKSKFSLLYPYAYQGIGLSYTAIMPNNTLGHPITLYLFQGSRLATFSDKLSLNYEWNFGASAGWRRHNINIPNGNPIIGSNINAMLNVGLMLSYQLSSQWSLKAGLNATHYSNGNTHIPNPGINTTGLRIGIAYTLTNTNDNELDTSEFNAEFIRGIGYDFTVYGATRQRIVFDSSDNEVVPSGSFGVVGLNFSPMYRLNKYWRIGASLDFQYDESANIQNHIAPDTYDENVKFYRPPFNECFSTGLSVRAEFTMPIFSINAGLGRNIIAKGHDTTIFYQTLALKAYILHGAYLQIGYQLSNFHRPNNLMLGVGYTFGHK